MGGPVSEARSSGLGKVFLYREHFTNVYFGFAKKLEKKAMMIVREKRIEAVESW